MLITHLSSLTLTHLSGTHTSLFLPAFLVVGGWCLCHQWAWRFFPSPTTTHTTTPFPQVTVTGGGWVMLIPVYIIYISLFLHTAPHLPPAGENSGMYDLSARCIKTRATLRATYTPRLLLWRPLLFRACIYTTAPCDDAHAAIPVVPAFSVMVVFDARVTHALLPHPHPRLHTAPTRLTARAQRASLR